jgi:hypothetical protein
MEGELREELTSVYKTMAMVPGRRVPRERGTPPPCHRRVPDAQGGGALELSDSFEPERFALEGTPVAGRRLNAPPPEHWERRFKTPKPGRQKRNGRSDRRAPGFKPRAQFAFKDSMIHGILQFTLRIAVCCVLHRRTSRGVHR